MPYPENPIIACAERTGYAPGQPAENVDCYDLRKEFAEDSAVEFVYFVLRYDPSILDDYIEANKPEYTRWRGGATI